MKMRRKKLTEKIVHKNPWFHVRHDKVVRTDGEKGDYFVVVTPPSVFVVALDQTQRVYLIEQHRYPTSRYSVEIPGGRSDGDKPLVAAKRELQEETGLVAKSWKLIGKFQAANGLMSEIGFVYLAQDLTQTGYNHQQEEGIVKVTTTPFKKVLKMIKDGQITDGQTITAIHFASNYIKI